MPSIASKNPSDYRSDCAVVGQLASMLLLIVGVSLGMVFGLTSPQRLAQLSKLVYHEDGFRCLELALTPARLLALRLVIIIAAICGLLSWWAIRTLAQGILRSQLHQAGIRLRHYWRRMPASARRSTLLGVGLVLVARLYYAVAYPLSTDEIASYDYFVVQGPRAILSYYPIPNNHVLYNLLAWLLHLSSLPPLLVMRLPTWALGCVSLALTLGLLGRVVGLQRAWIVTLLAGLAPISVYYGAVGRGYGLQLGMVQLGFFAVLELLRPQSHYRQLAWAALVLSSLAGLLLVPSYAYPLAALLLALLVHFMQNRNWAALGTLVLAATSIGVLVLVFYSPIIAVSGWKQLVANRYVTSRVASQFCPGFRPRLYEVAAELFVPSVRLSGPLWLGLALLGGAISLRIHSGWRRQAALVAWLLVGLPIALLMAQRVFPLARVLLYVPWASCVWLVVVFPRWRSTLTTKRWATRLMLGCTASLGLYRLYLNEPSLQGTQRETRLVQQAYHWLQQASAQEHVRPIIGLQAPIHELFFAHYQTNNSPKPLRLVSFRTLWPNEAYDFIILNHAVAGKCQVPAPYRASYSDALVTIYTKAALRPQPALTFIPSRVH